MITTRTRIVLVVLCVTITYWNGLSTPFLLDDRTSVLTNTSIETLALPGPLLTPSDTPVARRPLVNLSFALNYAMAERSVRWYHATNLVIHILAALVLFGLVRRTLLLPPLDRHFGAAAAPVAWVCALVWALHPLNSEVIDYVTQRSEGMLGLFYLLTIYCAIRSATARSGGRWDVATVVCCAAGMLCKESMVTAPLLVVLYDRVFLFDAWKPLVARRARLYAGLATSWLVLGMVIRSSERTSAGFNAGVSSWDYLLNQAQLIPRYLYLSVWPRALVVDYGTTGTIPFSSVVVPGVLLVIAAALVVVGLVRWPRAAFPAAWFFITLAPTSSLVPIATEVGAERRMYLPLAGLVVLVVTFGYRLANRYRLAATPLRAATGIVIVLLAVGTVLRNREYADPVRLAERVVERWPSGRAHVHLGTLYAERGDQDGAIRQFRLGAAAYPPGYYTLGVALVENHQVDEGIAHLRRFIAMQPRHNAVTGARDLIGRVLIDRGDLESASREFDLLIADDPHNARAMVLLAEVRLRQERLHDAIALFERARGIDAAVGRDATMMKRFGTALAMADRLNDAERIFAEAAAANPQDAVLQKLWGRSLAAMGRFAAAADRFRHAWALAPDDGEARELVAAIEQRVGLARNTRRQ